MKFIYLIIITAFLLPQIQYSSFAEGNTKAEKIDDQKIYYSDIEKSIVPNGNKGRKLYDRTLWNLRSQLNPDGSILRPGQFKEINRQFNNQNKKGDAQLYGSGWVPVGPTELSIAYDTVSGHCQGRLNHIAFHPTDSNTFWVSSPNGGIWKTEDAGANWAPMDDQLPTLCMTSVAVDPNNPDVLYAATGDYDNSSWINNGKALGVFKSTDGGLNWEATGLSYLAEGFSYSYIRKIFVHPDNSDKLLAAGSRGIWVSDDGGSRWEQIIDTLAVADIEQDPSNPDVFYAATRFYSLWPGYNYSNTYILKTTDFGTSWTTLDSKIPMDGAVSRVELAIAPTDPDYVYALAVDYRDRDFYGLYRTTDAGETWTVRADYTDNNNILGWYTGDQDDQSGQGYYDLTLLVDKNDKDKIYTGGVNLWESSDGGESWQIISLWINAFGPSIHADQHFMNYNPVDGYYYVCNDGGVFRTQEIEGVSPSWISDWIDPATENVKEGFPGLSFPTEWENLTSGLAITEFYRIGLSRDNPGYVCGGAQDNSCFYYNNSEWINYVTNYDGMEAFISHDDPEAIYGSAQYGILFRSDDGGKNQYRKLTDTIINTEGRGGWVTPFLMDPVNSDIIYAGFKNVWRSTNRGDDWELFFNLNPVTISSLNINAMAIAPNNPDIMLVSKPNQPYYDSTLVHELWYTGDGGENWESLREGLPLDSIDVASIAISATDNNRIWLVLNSGVNGLKILTTGDYTQGWENISKDIPNITINKIVHQAGSENNTLYIGTNRGVYFTHDEMDLWLPLNDNLPNIDVRDLEIDYNSNKLYAGTYGRGIWMTDLLPAENYVSDLVREKPSFKVYPNPSNGLFHIELKDSAMVYNKKEDLKLEIVDIFGNSVYSEELPHQNVDMELNPDLISGKYFIKISSGIRMKVKSIVITK